MAIYLQALPRGRGLRWTENSTSFALQAAQRSRLLRLSKVASQPTIFAKATGSVVRSC